MSDSHVIDHRVEPPDFGSRLYHAFDKLWPHVAAWGLAAVLSFIAVRERLSLMEARAGTLLERVQALEEARKTHDATIQGIRENTAASRAMLEALIKESDERRGEERRAYRARIDKER